MTHPEEDRLSAALAELPRPTAPPGFTPRLLARLERRRARHRRLRRWSWAAAAVAGALLLLVAVERPPAPTTPASLSERAAELRREQLALRQELEALRRLSEETAPVLYLGSEPEFDVVLDLRPIPVEPGTPGVRPAAYRAPAGTEPRRR